MSDCKHCGSSEWEPMDPDENLHIGWEVSAGESSFWVSMNCADCGSSNSLQFDLVKVELEPGNIIEAS